MPQAQNNPDTTLLSEDDVHAIQVFLEMQGIELLGGDVWGRRKDLAVEDATIVKIRTLAAAGAPLTM